jgi:hypothetical protein
MAHTLPAATFFDGLTRPSMRMLVRIYLFDGAPHGATVNGLVQYWRARSPSWRAVARDDPRASIEAALTRRFLSEGLCGVDGSLPSHQLTPAAGQWRS